MFLLKEDVWRKRSLNLISAAKKAKELGIEVVSFVARMGRTKISDTPAVKNNSTAMVQQAHITLAHAICELLEN